MQFLTLERDAFTYGVAAPVAPLVRRVIAENPSKFTYHGTGTYIVGGNSTGKGDVVVIDPGPRLDSHRDALAAALDGYTVRAILVTHCHADHSPLADPGILQVQRGLGENAARRVRRAEKQDPQRRFRPPGDG